MQNLTRPAWASKNYNYIHLQLNFDLSPILKECHITFNNLRINTFETNDM